MTYGHEVHPLGSRQEYARRLLTEVETGNGTSQRSLARRAGMALGLTNVVLKELVHRGWVEVVRAGGMMRYVITPAGSAEKARMSTAYFAYTTRFYAEARARVLERLTHLSQTWNAPSGGHGKRVAFYGAGEVAEIGYICVGETDLRVAVAFDDAPRRFIGARAQPLSRLAERGIWSEFDMLVVMSFEDATRKRAELHLADVGFPAERTFWI